MTASNSQEFEVKLEKGDNGILHSGKWRKPEEPPSVTIRVISVRRTGSPVVER